MTEPEQSDSRLADDLAACFREHQLLREALVELMAVSRAYLEPGGYPYGNPAMAKARAALGGCRS